MMNVPFWQLASADISDTATIHELLDEGWEPFAVASNRVYFRRRVIDTAYGEVVVT